MNYETNRGATKRPIPANASANCSSVGVPPRVNTQTIIGVSGFGQTTAMSHHIPAAMARFVADGPGLGKAGAQAIIARLATNNVYNDDRP